MAHLISSLASLIHKEEPVASFAQRIEVVAELMMVVARAPVEDQDRVAVLGAALNHVQPRVADVHQPALVVHARTPMLARAAVATARPSRSRFHNQPPLARWPCPRSSVG